MEQYVVLIGLGVQTILFLSGGYAMVLRNDWSNKVLNSKVIDMEKELKGLAKIITEMAVQTTRIDNLTNQYTLLHRTVEDLRRGNGFVRSRDNGINGEYK